MKSVLTNMCTLTATKAAFRLAYREQSLIVQEHTIAGAQVFHVVFPDRTPSLTLCRASGTEIGKHWTSIPEGRFKEAQAIGSLIVEKIREEQL